MKEKIEYEESERERGRKSSEMRSSSIRKEIDRQERGKEKDRQGRKTGTTKKGEQDAGRSSFVLSRAILMRRTCYMEWNKVECGGGRKWRTTGARRVKRVASRCAKKKSGVARNTKEGHTRPPNLRRRWKDRR